MFRRRNYLINSSLVILLVAVGYFGWRTLYPPVAAAAARTTAASIQDVSTSVSATGSVQAAVDLGLNFGSTGIVRQLNVKVGDKVKKGELLAAIDDRSAKLSLLQSQSSELSAQTSYKNAQNGVKTAQNSVITAQGLGHDCARSSNERRKFSDKCANFTCQCRSGNSRCGKGSSHYFGK
ncbi:MAG: biotin/lipoyl-binding protein [Actinomycetota bacterium]